MADLTPLDEKLGEVLGLAQAAQTVTETVSKMVGAGAFRDELETMGRQAEETERRTDASIDGQEGRKTAIREKARETKSEAAELCHWEIVGEMAQKIGDQATKELAEWAVAVQRGHIEIVRRAALALAADEAEALV